MCVSLHDRLALVGKRKKIIIGATCEVICCFRKGGGNREEMRKYVGTNTEVSWSTSWGFGVEHECREEKVKRTAYPLQGTPCSGERKSRLRRREKGTGPRGQKRASSWVALRSLECVHKGRGAESSPWRGAEKTPGDLKTAHLGGLTT